MQSRDTAIKPEMIPPAQKAKPDPCILGVDRFNHAIVIQFEDGTCACFSAKLLRSLLPKLAPSARCIEEQYTID